MGGALYRTAEDVEYEFSRNGDGMHQFNRPIRLKQCSASWLLSSRARLWPVCDSQEWRSVFPEAATQTTAGIGDYHCVAGAGMGFSPCVHQRHPPSLREMPLIQCGLRCPIAEGADD